MFYAVVKEKGKFNTINSLNNPDDFVRGGVAGIVKKEERTLFGIFSVASHAYDFQLKCIQSAPVVKEAEPVNPTKSQ